MDYNDADWNYLGSSYSDEFGSGYNFNEVIDGIRYEKGSENRYKVDNQNNVIVDEDSGEPIISDASSYEYRFDAATGEMLGGTQVNGPTTITYGANFEIESSVTEIDTTGGNFDEVDVDSEFPTAFADALMYLMVMPSTHRLMIWAGVLKRPSIRLLTQVAVFLVTQHQRVMKARKVQVPLHIMTLNTCGLVM